MSLFIEPGTTTVEGAGEKIEVLILSARDRLKIFHIAAEIAELAKTVDDEGEILPTTTAAIQGKHLDIIELATPEDTKPVRLKHWPALVSAIWEANQLSETDAKN